MPAKPKKPAQERKLAPYVRFDPDVAAKLCELISTGLTVREVEHMDGMPNRRTIARWKHRHPGFAKDYLTASRVLAAFSPPLIT